MTDKPNTVELPKPRCRWFQFRLRTLLIGMALLGPACAYVVHEASIVQARKAWLTNHDEAMPVLLTPGWDYAHPEALPSVLRRWFGDDGYFAIHAWPSDEDEAGRLFPEAVVLPALW